MKIVESEKMISELIGHTEPVEVLSRFVNTISL